MSTTVYCDEKCERKVVAGSQARGICINKKSALKCRAVLKRIQAVSKEINLRVIKETIRRVFW